MLKIVRSGFSASAREAFCREIELLCQNDSKSCLIVPEQQTLIAETMMSERLAPSSNLVFEVTNFTRLANTVFRSLGGLAGEYCDSAKKALIMWKTLTELSPMLSMTSARREINAGMVESALAAVAEMQTLAISPAELMESAEFSAISGDGRLVGKISDLSRIYSLYKSLLAEKYLDTGDDSEAMVKKLSENPDFLSDTKIFIEGFTSFTEPQYRLIALLSERTDVSVALCLPKGREDAYEFSEIAKAENRLIAYARKFSVDLKRTREDGCQPKNRESLGEICSYLWSTIAPNDNITLQNDQELRIFEAKTPYDECAFICEDIKRRVMAGASYRDFAIIARNADKYDGILDYALSGAKIPAFTSYRRDVREFEAVKMIYTAYAISRGFAREDVLSFAKCALSPVSREECDEFEMYVNKWQINGKRFTDELVWNMNPLGYTTRKPDGCDEKLARIHNTRLKLIEPLSAFAERIKEASTVRAHAEALLDFLLSIEMELAINAQADTLAAMGEVEMAEENRSLWKMICDSLDTLVSVVGDSPADADAFLSQLKIVFSATDIGRIPAYYHQVTVGSADMLRLYSKPHVYLMGVNAGEFPAGVSDSSYFSEQDRRLLSESGLIIEPELEIKGARELYVFSRAFSYATDSVTLTYSAADTRFKSRERAEVIDKITALTGGAVRPVKISELDVSERLFSAENALMRIDESEREYSAIREALIQSGYGREIEISEGDITNSSASLGKEIVSGYKDRPLSLTQSRIDSFVSCPFGYFCRYTIDLSEDERAEFDARGIGTFVHAVLENFFRALNDEGKKSGELSLDEKEALTRKAAEKYVSELSDDAINNSARTKIKIDRLTRAALPVVDGLCEEFSLSAYEPRFFELSLSGGEDSPAPVTLDSEGGGVKIYGIIDRVDAYKKGEDVYLRVIDYKTGQKKFSPEDMANGQNLQMFLYLKALVESENEKFRKRVGVGEGGKILPGGVIYVKTAIGGQKVDMPDDSLALDAVKDAQAREGMILDDEDSITAMNLKYTPVYSKRYPDKISEDKKKFLYDEPGWQKIMTEVEASVTKVADSIRTGELPATPNKQSDRSPCEYCKYKPICRKVEIK